MKQTNKTTFGKLGKSNWRWRVKKKTSRIYCHWH